ncbi:hypothetical protein ACLKA6_010263 [Drosophila palustris]
MSLPTKEAQKPELIGDVGIATTSKSGPDVFGDIDKRLSALLDRANKLESTLNRLNDERADNNSDLDPDMDLISSEDVDDDEYNLEVDDLDLDADDYDIDDAEDSDADNTEKIDLNAHED